MKKALFVIILLIAGITLLSVIGRKRLSTEVVINAPVEKVWKEFSNFRNYPKWNPFIKSLTGDVKVGSKIYVTIQPKDGTPMDFNPVVIQMKEYNVLQWEGRLLLPGIFTGKHTFTLVPLDKKKTKFIQEEDFNGILVPFFDLNPTLEGFKSMNTLLRARAEQ